MKKEYILDKKLSNHISKVRYKLLKKRLLHKLHCETFLSFYIKNK